MTSSEMTPADIAAVTGNRSGGGGFGYGDGAWWIIILFLFAAMNGWGNNGNNGGGNSGAGNLYPWLNNSNQINDGFQNQLMNDNITSIRDGVVGLQNQLCNGFAQAEIAENSRQMANMNQMFNLQSAFQNCCCENRLATAQTQNIVQSEGAATRLAIQNQTQAILDKLCQLELDGLKQDNANLRTQLNMANLAASQVAQTAQILQGQTAEVDALYNRLRNCPVPTQPVYGSQPIFTCNGNQGGCVCGMA